MNPIALLLPLLIVARPAPLPAATLQPASTSTDHLILQRDRSIPVWGRPPAGATVIVTSDRSAAPVAVRYGWANVPEANLFNREALPASPFPTASEP